MRNLRKLTAAVLAVALVLTSMTAVFAADAATLANADKAVTLKDLGLYSGQDANDPKVGLENALTTQDSLIFLAKLFGYFETASALTDDKVAEELAKFDDAASISNYAKKVVAYSASKEIIKGIEDGDKLSVGANDTVTAARFATFMLKQMGYELADYKLAVAKLAETKGSKVDATVTGDLTRDAAVGIMYAALTAEKASGKTVIVDIVGDNADLKAKAEKLGLIAAEVVTTDVVVESVKAINTKQLEVVFNQEMDKDSVQTESFYEVQDKGSTKIELGDDSASLGDDGKTVTITLNKVITDKLTNSSEAKVTVKKDIKSKSGVKLAKNATFEKVEVQDGLLPTVTGVEFTGERTIKVTFSEPVYSTLANNHDNINALNFKIISGTFEYVVQSTELKGNVINLTIGTNLIEGPVVVTVNNEGSEKDYAVRDYAGYPAFKASSTYNYVKDISVPVVTVKEAKTSYVTLAFSKPVKGTNVKLYHSVKNSIYVATLDTNSKYESELKFVFDDGKAEGSAVDHPLPQGNVKLFLVNDTASDSNKLIDGFSVKVPDQTLTTEIVIDETAPTFTGGDFYKNTKIFLTFDEELDGSKAEDEENYTIKKASGTDELDFVAYWEQTPDNAEKKEKTVILMPSDNLDDNTEYLVTIKKAEDKVGNVTTKENTYTFTTGDNTSPKVKDSVYADEKDDTAQNQCYAVNGEGKIYITFTEAMNESQMLDKDNYMVMAKYVDTTSGAAIDFEALGEDDKVVKVSDRKICIALDKDIASEYLPSVKIAPIMDLAGKRLYDKVDSKTVLGIKGEEVLVSSAKLIAKNKVKVTFNTQIKAFNNRDILFTLDGATQTEVSTSSYESQVVNDDGNTEVVLVLNKDLVTDVTYTDANKVNGTIGAVTAATTSSESVSGTKLAVGKTVVIEDKTAPEVVKFNHDSDTSTDEVASVITSMTGNKQQKDNEGFIFIECSEEIDFASLSVLSFTVKGYSVIGIGVVGDNNNVVVLEVKADDTVTTYPTVTQVYNITDIKGNVLASGSTWTTRAPLQK